MISGAGFVNPTVYLEEPCGGAKFNCDIMSYTYETINCNLAPISSLAAEFDINFVTNVVVNDVAYTMDFSLNSEDAFTPKITSISPTGATASGTVLTVSGTALDGLSVAVGGSPCAEVSASSTEYQCTMADQAAGFHSIQINGEFGAATSSIQLSMESNLDATGISPAEGGTNGGEMITVDGLTKGFDENTVLTVRDADGHALCLFC